MSLRSLFTLSLLFFAVALSSAVEIGNPYAPVDWSWRQHRSNLHTHTTESDGQWSPDRTIDAYRELGYTILALADHNKVSYPWSRWNRDPQALGMLAIQANELSRGHHVGSYFTDLNSGRGLEGNVAAVGEAGGIAVIFHPGRYLRETPTAENVANYVAVYRENPHAVGLEVVNQRDRYPGDRAIWDAILTQLMPERPVWGFANDDFHRPDHLGRSWTMFLIPELSLENFRQAMIAGTFYSMARDMSRSGQRDEDTMPPLIREIRVQRNTITIDAVNAEGIVWIAQGEEIHRGPTLTIPTGGNLPNYVRAELYNPGGTTFTNPFGLRR